MKLNDNAVAAVSRAVEERGRHGGSAGYLQHLLRLLAKWRSLLIANSLLEREGAVVLNGPFAGMLYGRHATEGALAPRLLGSYESELHPMIRALAGEPFEAVIDIGCAEGYYAVGLARLMPNVTVYAHDIDEKARRACAELAAVNDVAQRVRIGGAFSGTDFADFGGRRTLVFIDAEGIEDELLEPDAFPALRGMSLIVETHGHARPGVIERLTARFDQSHQIARIEQGPKSTPLPTWFRNFGHLDQLLAVWEWRAHPTPWLVMTPRR